MDRNKLHKILSYYADDRLTHIEAMDRIEELHTADLEARKISLEELKAEDKRICEEVLRIPYHELGVASLYLPTLLKFINSRITGWIICNGCDRHETTPQSHA